MNTAVTTTQMEQSSAELNRIRQALQQAVLGQETLIEFVVMGIFAGGHLLLEGAPGLGKTHLAKGLARTLSLQLARIQCTPDLLPADITGSETLGADGHLTYRAGPLFAHLVLVDEINRATPRTQAAFLEAMAEHQVTYLGESRPLPDPFWLIATQNPIELEGTYPLPEAQLDRFLFKLLVPYPSASELAALGRMTLNEEPVLGLAPVVDDQAMRRIGDCIRSVVIAEPVLQAAARLILATQPDAADSAPEVREQVRYGASPRALQAMLRAARVRALMQDRAHVALEDLAAVAPPVLRHRLLLTFESTLDGLSADSLIRTLAERCLV